jgi:hypothetical protein
VRVCDHLGKKKKKKEICEGKKKTLGDYANFYIISTKNHILRLIK